MFIRYRACSFIGDGQRRVRWLRLRLVSVVPGLVLGLVLALGGCASVAPQRSAAPAAQASAPAGSNTRTLAAEALAIEQQWLQDWFRGTPVRIAQRSDGSLGIDVPREFCFDAGRSQVKPALSAVLDKVAQSLHRRPSARLTLLAGPADPGGASQPAALALQRAAVMQRHLRDRGVALARLGEPRAEGSANVQLRMDMPTP
jgi:outer membrane protein OmpA-like peptidoglycan-associated protein